MNERERKLLKRNEKEKIRERGRYQGTELRRGEMEGEKMCCEGMIWRERRENI